MLTEQTIEHSMEHLGCEILGLIGCSYLTLTSTCRTESVTLTHYTCHLQLLSCPNTAHPSVKHMFHIFFMERPSCCIEFFARRGFPVVPFEKPNQFTNARLLTKSHLARLQYRCEVGLPQEAVFRRVRSSTQSKTAAGYPGLFDWRRDRTTSSKKPSQITVGGFVQVLVGYVRAILLHFQPPRCSDPDSPLYRIDHRPSSSSLACIQHAGNLAASR